METEKCFSINRDEENAERTKGIAREKLRRARSAKAQRVVFLIVARKAEEIHELLSEF